MANLSINISSFPKCSKCKGDMVLVKVIETEIESFDKRGEVSLTRPAGTDIDEKKALYAVVFMWKCSCGNQITEKID